MPGRLSIGSIGRAFILAAVAVSASSSLAQAQRLSESRVGMSAASAPIVADVTAVPQQAVDHKEPVVAGVLSWLIPGLGSFYAGNSKHGVIHLGVHLGAFVLYVVGLASAVDTIDSYGNVSSGSFALAGISLIAILVNDVWSIFTAVGDANAHNGGATPGRVVGELNLAPANMAIPSSFAPQGAAQGTLRLRLVNAKF